MFCVMCTDKPDSLDLRMETRGAHIDYVINSAALAAAGAFLDDDGNMVGTLIMLQVDSRAQAEQWAANDPYAKAGLFAKVEIRRWQHSLGTLTPPAPPASPTQKEA